MILVYCPPLSNGMIFVDKSIFHQVMITLDKKTGLPLLIVILVISVTSCLSTKKYEEEERQKIQDYLTLHPDLNFELKPSGLYYLDVVVGTGIQPVAHDTAYIFFDAKYLTDVSFGGNMGTTDTLKTPVSEGVNIAGFDEAITYMKEGGKSKFIVPSFLGHGNSGYYFPAYTPIVFDLHLVKVKAGPGAK
jgi:FKBP-type peptidyl-prolyl cis-trans isomerase